MLPTNFGPNGNYWVKVFRSHGTVLTIKFLVGTIENLAVNMFVRQRRGCMDE